MDQAAPTFAIQPVILAGGMGTRLWPLSRTFYPKQLLPLCGTQTMLQETAARLGGPPFLPPMVICGEESAFIVDNQLRGIGTPAGTIVVEPVGRNTAPAAAIAAVLAARLDPETLLLLLPADHVIKDIKAFRQVVDTAAAAAAEGYLTTFGIVPAQPETGYGYIKVGESLGSGYHRVETFVEKPDQATAQRYLAEGNWLWNSGMFLFQAGAFLSELERLQPEMLRACRTIVERIECGHGNMMHLDRALFAAVTAESIDFAVMEHTDRAVVVPADIGWSDVGSWSALWDISSKDDGGNVILGDVVADGVEGCYLRSDGRMVAALGVKDLILVETEDAILVASKERAQDVKKIVDLLKIRGRGEHTTHAKVHRPWGWYQSIDSGDRFQVKHISVDPGASLSLQLHHHRAEHWVVVSGTARVVCGDKTSLVHENQSVYIPIGTTHRLENPGKIPLRLIEVQSGSYLGEDDIIRFDDAYGRSSAGPNGEKT